MSLVTLFSDEHGFLATDQLVYTADQMHRLHDAASMAAKLSNAISDQNQMNEAAQSEGFRAGYELGVQQALVESNKQLEQTLAKLHQAYNRDVGLQQEACASLAVDIVRKIAGQVAPADWLCAEATTAAAELVDQTGLVLRVNSAQLDSVQERLAGNPMFERIVADEAVAIDGGSIDTRYGKIDVDLETQIERVLSLFAEHDVK